MAEDAEGAGAVLLKLDRPITTERIVELRSTGIRRFIPLPQASMCGAPKPLTSAVRPSSNPLQICVGARDRIFRACHKTDAFVRRPVIPSDAMEDAGVAHWGHLLKLFDMIGTRCYGSKHTADAARFLQYHDMLGQPYGDGLETYHLCNVCISRQSNTAPRASLQECTLCS
jgi:hypothetical protein